MDEGQRHRIVAEIIETEKRYLAALSILQNVFIAQLQKHPNAKVLRQYKEFTSINNALNTIQRINAHLLSALQQSQQNNDSIGKIFLRTSPFLKNYNIYFTHYNIFSTIMRNLKQNDEKFKELFASIQSKAKAKGMMGFDSYLIQPIQRVPRYVLLLSTLLSDYEKLKKRAASGASVIWTEEQETEMNDLSKALDEMKDVTNFLNQKIRELDNMKKLTRIQKLINYSMCATDTSLSVQTISSTPIFYELAKPSRKYIFEGFLQLEVIFHQEVQQDAQYLRHQDLKQERYFYLFSDLLLICTVELIPEEQAAREDFQHLLGSRLSSTMMPQSIIPSVAERVIGIYINFEVPLDTNPLPTVQDVNLEGYFQVITPSLCFTLNAKDKSLKDAWMKYINEAINAIEKKKEEPSAKAVVEEDAAIPSDIKESVLLIQSAMRGYLVRNPILKIQSAEPLNSDITEISPTFISQPASTSFIPPPPPAPATTVQPLPKNLFGSSAPTESQIKSLQQRKQSNALWIHEILSKYGTSNKFGFTVQQAKEHTLPILQQQQQQQAASSMREIKRIRTPTVLRHSPNTVSASLPANSSAASSSKKMRLSISRRMRTSVMGSASPKINRRKSLENVKKIDIGSLTPSRVEDESLLKTFEIINEQRTALSSEQAALESLVVRRNTVRQSKIAQTAAAPQVVPQQPTQEEASTIVQQHQAAATSEQGSSTSPNNAAASKEELQAQPDAITPEATSS